MNCPFCHIDSTHPTQEMDAPVPPKMRRIVGATHDNITALTNLYGDQGAHAARWEVRQCPQCGFTARFWHD